MLLKNKRIDYTVWLSFFLSLILIYFRFDSPVRSVLSWDVFGYYLYLPLTFLEGNLGLNDMTYVHGIADQYNVSATLYQLYPNDAGGFIIKYPPGLAILYLPFFLIGYIWAILSGYPVDGFSLPFQYSVVAGGILISVVGIFFLRAVLVKLFNRTLTAIILLIIVIGTNYFHDATVSTLMPHNILFTAYAAILYYTIKLHESWKVKHAVVLALICGITIISRLSEIVCLFIPLLWEVKSISDFKGKIRLLIEKRKVFFLFSSILILVGLIQIAYWKFASGEFLHYSYQNPGEGLDLFSPHTLNVLFSFRKGWFIYTPLMIFATIGFYFMYRQKRKLFVPLFTYFLFNLWIVSSWTCWWYAESFGQRALVQSYPIMAVALGYFLYWINKRKLILKVLLFLLIALFVALNQFQAWQLNHGILHASRMTRDYYFEIFGKTRVSDSAKNLLLVNRSFNGKEYIRNPENYYLKNSVEQGFEDSTSKQFVDTISYSGVYSYQLDSLHRFAPKVSIPYSEITDDYHAWIKVHCKIFPVHDPEINEGSLVVTFSHNGKAYKYRTVELKDPSNNLKLNKWNTLSFVYLTPEVRSKNDKLEVYYWHRGNLPIYVDDIRIEIFERKRR